MSSGWAGIRICRQTIPSGEAVVRFFPLLLCVFLGAGVVTSARGADAANLVHAQLFLAQNSDIRNDVPKGAPLRKSLDPVIGYNFYQQLGDAWAKVDADDPKWLLPCKTFYFQIHPLENGAYRVSLWQEKQLIVNCSLTPQRGVPLIITGPRHGEGLLVLVLTWPDAI